MGEALDLVGIGNAIVDFFVCVDEGAEETLGLHLDSSIHVEHEGLLRIIQDLPEAEAISGGGAANVVKIAALLGLKTAFVGRVGSGGIGKNDELAALFESQLRSAGVTPILAHGKEPTGACVILRTASSRSAIAACPSAALGLGADDIDENLLRKAKILVIDGFILGRKPLVERAREIANKHGLVVAMDVGAAPIAAAHAEFILSVAKTQPLILFLNEAEAISMSRALRAIPSSAQAEPECRDELNLDERLAPLRELTEEGPFPIVIVKRDARGALIFAGGARYDAPTRELRPIDSTGAGDAFAAGFLSAWIRGKSIAECAAFGNRVGAQAVMVWGSNLKPDRMSRLKEALTP